MRCVNPLPPYYANNFSMHGLWPAAADGRTLQSTRRPRRIPDDVFERIESKMNRWWANINSRHASRSFWEHEWSKHGVTGNWGEDGAQNYFLDGIRSRQNIDLLFILRSGGIRFNTYYTKRDIVGAIRKWLPVQNIYISCSGRPGGFYYLHEIFICLDHNLNYISCPLDSNPRRCFGDFFQIPST
ncbi:hypothetical protein DCAR_0103277 [Daucus carota subsp. sativus]|uniref:Uncharacterized protein n=1 Tax=Daucus carota subsp. sativus TaxID=79200 RepID=A0A166HVP8_DAUCS|nr:hypothetical protein DCAR_0103277 [Daucus carota subsp. sativus]